MLETIIILLICIVALFEIHNHPEATIRLKDKYKLNRSKGKPDIFDNMDINDYEKRVVEMKKRSKTGMLFLGIMVTILVLATLGHIVMWSFQGVDL